MTDRTKGWCILRTASVSTLRLADSLAASGIEAWAPREEIRKVVRGKLDWIATPMLPTFVFADAARLGELIALARSPALSYQVWDSDRRRMVTRGYPQFHLFHIGNDYRAVPDHELAALRRIEGRRKRKPRGKPRAWGVGDRVRLTEGAYEGLRGAITEIEGKKIWVLVPGYSLSFYVSAFDLHPDVDSATDSGVSVDQFRHAA